VRYTITIDIDGWCDDEAELVKIVEDQIPEAYMVRVQHVCRACDGNVYRIDKECCDDCEHLAKVR
jgi:hypothetical protein